jgi:hypothetical protein
VLRTQGAAIVERREAGEALERRLRILVLENQFFRSPEREPAWIEG